MNTRYIRSLRALAREMQVPASLVEAGLEGGRFRLEAAPEADCGTLRQARRPMLNLLLHPDARLTQAEKEQLIQGLEASLH